MNEQFFKFAYNDLISFSIITNNKYKPSWHHNIIAKELEELEKKIIDPKEEKISFLLLELPPRHGKSQLASINFPAWFLGRNPDKEIITASYSSDLAIDFGSKTRELFSTDVYQNIFNIKLKADDRSKAKWRTEKGGSYISVGVGGAMTGRGTNCLIIDDPFKNREEADSLVIREKIWDWFTSTAFTRLEPRGVVILIMTRWHVDDLAGRIIDNLKERDDINFKRLKFPAVAIEDEYIKEEKVREKGVALWESKYNLDQLNSIRRTIGIMDWSALYQQSPILVDNPYFKDDWFNYYNEEDIKNKELEYFMTVDLAISDKEESDETVILTIGKDNNLKRWYIINIIHGNLNPLQTIDAIFSEFLKYNHLKIGIESVAYQKALLYFINEKMNSSNIYLPIMEIKSNKSKELRIKGLSPLYQSGIIRHKKEHFKLESQLLNFPKDKHDDLADALAMQMFIMPNTNMDDDKNYINSYNKYITAEHEIKF